MAEFDRQEPELLSPIPENGPQPPSPPPHPLDSKWFINVQDKTHGPYSGHQLRSYIQDGRMTANTMVLPVESTKWTRTVDDPVLCAYLPQPAATNALPANGKVNAAEGSTVVQVTNNISQPTAPSLIIQGPAAQKSAGLAAFLSLLIPGLGQCYNGQVGKGILMFIGCALLWLVMLGWIVWIWSPIDAYQTAKAMNLRYMALVANGRAVVV